MIKNNILYLIGLDNDDFFSYKQIFKTSYLSANINYFDIVEIKSFNIPNYNPRYREVRNGNKIYCL